MGAGTVASVPGGVMAACASMVHAQEPDAGLLRPGAAEYS
jgi:hypothetical protein